MTETISAVNLQKLVEAFTPLLDEALVCAIAHDHELEKESEYDAVYSILQGLAQDVAVEEATGFNPSGISASVGDPDDAANDALSAATDSISQQTSHTQVTEPSSTDASPSSAASPSLPRLTTFNNDSEESKIAQLRSMFSELKEYDVQHSLKKANGDFQVALDDLLNLQYLRSTGQITKGLDGFFQPDEAPQVKRKGKGKRGGKGKKALLEESALPNLDISMLDDAKLSKHQDDIAYITDRIDISYNEVSEIYYRKKCSPGATVVEILDRFIAHGIETQDEAGKKYAHELAQKYSLVHEKYMATIVQVAGPIPQFSDDLASLLNKHFTKNPWSEKMDLSYRLTPLPHGEIDESMHNISSKLATTRLRSPPTSPASPSRYADLSQALQMSNHLNQARRDASASASQLHKRGGSSPLYRQAAGYYSDRARELGRQAQQVTSTAADLLVVQQSTSNSIDLHGVYVHDGVRIARQRVQEWWQGLGEIRSTKARAEPYTVITGLGRHSANGVSQLRQAVAAALLQDGWRMQIETGRFVISGRR